MTWSKGVVEWIEGDTAFVSCVFSWHLQEAYQRCAWLKAQGYRVRAGGPAVTMNPEVLSGVAELGGEVNALVHHNPDATYTSRGCIRRCSFCAVPKIEGKLRELSDDEWEPKPIICDNNLLATSLKHFDHVIDRLLEAGIKGVDLNGGLDARILTDHHAQRISELPKATMKLAWDNIGDEKKFMSAHNTLTKAGIKPEAIHVYVLLGFKDTPAETLYRLKKVMSLGSWPMPMRYQPLNALHKNEYVSPNWTAEELQKYMRYWARLMYFRHIPFEEWDTKIKRPKNRLIKLKHG